VLKQNDKSLPVNRAEFWREHIERWSRSHRSQRLYCQANGLALSTFQWWRRVLSKPVKSESFEIVPVSQFPTVSLAPESACLTLLLQDGRYRIEVGDGVRAEPLQLLLDVLESRL
jgi:hypothetical protein